MKRSEKMLSQKMIPLSNECAVCTKFGQLLCEGCGEAYCSRVCQVTDWREHRHFCKPIPRLMQRTDICNNAFPINRMLMEPKAIGFDAIDAMGSISEHSNQSETGKMSKEHISKLTTKLNKLQLDGSATVQQMEMKANLMGIEEVLSTPSSTSSKLHERKTEKVTKVDENANYGMTVSESPVKPVPKEAMVLTPPRKKTKNFKPWIQSIQPKIHVLLVHVENHQTVFVIPSCEVVQWKNLLERVDKYAKNAQPLSKPPHVGYVVLAKPKTSDLYSRALIKKIRAIDQLAKVEFMEYGFTEVISFAEMKCLTEELVNCPRLVNMLTLKGVPNDMENSAECVRFLVSLQEKKTELIVHQLDLIEKSNLCVHAKATLLDSEKFAVINDMIKELATVEAAPKIDVDDMPEPPSQPSRRQGIEHKYFSGKNIELFVLDNSFMEIGCFSAVKLSDISLLGKNDALVNKDAEAIEKLDPYYPRENETCLAKSLDDQRWYRASCQQKIDDNTYSMMYLDYGNMELVPVERIREMINEEFAFPCITSLCFIDDLNDMLTPQVVDRLKKMLQPYTRIVFDEANSTGEEVLCKSAEIINTLKSEGLI